VDDGAGAALDSFRQANVREFAEKPAHLTVVSAGLLCQILRVAVLSSAECDNCEQHKKLLEAEDRFPSVAC
jgi:hypothetical protein